MRVSKKRIERIGLTISHSIGGTGNDLLPRQKRIIGAPSPILGEAMSSWIERIATSIGIPSNEILKSWAIETPSFWLDCGSESLDFKVISTSTVKSIDSLRRFGWPSSTILADPRYACLTAEPLNRRPTYRYCPTCLATDPVPHIRQDWRYSFSYVCPVHSEILWDHCQKCQARLDLSAKRRAAVRTRHTARTILFCRQCGADLSATPSRYLPDNLFVWVLAKQKKLLSLVRRSSTLPSETPAADRPNLPLLKTDSGNRIRLEDRDNLNYLLSLVLDPALQSQIGHLSAEDCIRTLERYLRKPFPSRQGLNNQGFAIGLFGHQLFGTYARDISRHLSECQSYQGGTIWWRLETMTKDGIPSIATKEQVEVARSWAFNQGRSVLGFWAGAEIPSTRP